MWVLDKNLILPNLCTKLGAGLVNAMGLRAALELTFLINPPLELSLAWVLMLIAMMPPLLTQPINHVMKSNFRRTKRRSIAAFLLGYLSIWTLAGIPIMAMIITINIWGGNRFVIPGVIAILAFIWSASPWHQAALNRAHKRQRISPFGLRSLCENLQYGVKHGMWCLSSCWLWMIIPFMFGSYHYAAMIIAALIMFLDRLDPPGQPRWRIPGFIRVILSLIRATLEPKKAVI